MSRNVLRKKRKRRVRVTGTGKVPRLSVFRSNKHVYAQLIDDEKGKTLAGILSVSKGAKLKSAETVGEKLAEKAKALKITQAVFDRGGYKYHGRVKAIKEAAEKKGLVFKKN